MSNASEGAPPRSITTSGRRKILLIELWGLGDLTFSTPVIAAALERGDEVHLLGKPHAKQLLGPTFPGLRFITYEAPWTAYTGKYHLWKWNWPELIRLVAMLRSEHYDLAVSARNDPRDHFLMYLTHARQRVGVLRQDGDPLLDNSRRFLTLRIQRKRKQHKVEDWQQIGSEIGLPEAAIADPAFDHARYRAERIERLFANVKKPVICLHTGARIAVRRWPEQYFEYIIAQLRKLYDFHLVVIPEPLTLPSRLADIADTCLTGLDIGELVDVLGRCDLLLCNDSGPAHIAAACGRPVIPIFGPSDPDWFRPWGAMNKVILRDICPWRPCFDYCKFSEPFCMTHLLPHAVWPDIDGHIAKLIADGNLPQRLVKDAALHAGVDA